MYASQLYAEIPYADNPLVIILSSEFADGAEMPLSTCDPSIGGSGESPQLSWTAVPTTVEYAIKMIDLDAGNAVQWTCIHIPPAVLLLAHDASPIYTEPNAYLGPAPPIDTTHHYEFTVYALASIPVVPALPTDAQFSTAMSLAGIITSDTLTGIVFNSQSETIVAVPASPYVCTIGMPIAPITITVNDANAGATVTTRLVSGALPAGLSLSVALPHAAVVPYNMTITGTPTTLGLSAIVYSADDGDVHPPPQLSLSFSVIPGGAIPLVMGQLPLSIFGWRGGRQRIR